MPSYMRPSTLAVSARDSFLPIWEEAGSRKVTPMPRSRAPTSKAQRVRVEVFSNSSTTCLPVSHLCSTPLFFIRLNSADRSSI